MKVICAGMPKTGTKTMAAALEILGYNVHDIFQQFFLDREIWEKILSDKPTIGDYHKVFADVDSVMDFPGCGIWEQLLEAFPDAKVILTERCEDSWWKSVVHQCSNNARAYTLCRFGLPRFVLDFLYGPMHNRLLKYCRAFCPPILGIIDANTIPVEMFARTRFRQHNLYVKTVCPKDKLLIFNVKNGWDPLCKFLNVSVPDAPFPHLNIKGEIGSEMLKGKYDDSGYAKTVMREAKTRLFIVASAFVVFIAYLFTWMYSL